MNTQPHAKNRWQPVLAGSSLQLRPLTGEDFEPLFAAASDPLIWELHPDSDRYKREQFEVFFRTGMESKGALVISDLRSGRIIGSSRYTNENAEFSSIQIGFTFLTREYWGGATNRELKGLMLGYAFQFVKSAYFIVGKDNFRSRSAMRKIGGVEIHDAEWTPVTVDLSKSVIYAIRKSDWLKNDALGPFHQQDLHTRTS
jgi:RimJ/RimL family protein N-acetyltransferase